MTLKVGPTVAKSHADRFLSNRVRIRPLDIGTARSRYESTHRTRNQVSNAMGLGQGTYVHMWIDC